MREHKTKTYCILKNITFLFKKRIHVFSGKNIQINKVIDFYNQRVN